MEEHEQTVAAISSRVSSFSQRKQPYRIYHGSTNSTQHRKIDPNRMIDTSNLNHVIKVNKETKTCLVEPNVPMDQLVDATLPYGLLPPVVMEFPGITVGGGFSGTAGESSSFKHGFFEHTVRWIEIVLPNGEVVTASPTDRSDLFSGAAGTFGTLGVTTLLELNLIDSRRYVELTYHPAASVEEALTTMRLAAEIESNDYVDGILLSSSHGVIVSGRLTDDHAPGTKLQPFSRPQDPWFYIHADRITRNATDPVKEITPVRDYLFRYDRGAFWTGKYAFSYFLTPFNRITRYLLDYFMHTRVMYHALHASGHASRYVIQDLLLPSDGVQAFIDFVSTEFGFWPLWLCPLKAAREISLHPRMADQSKSEKGRMFINVGVWGPGPGKYEQFVDLNRRLEHKVRELGGLKWLYAQAYYTKAEFDSIYDRKWYDALREKYHATYLPTVYDKVKVDLEKYQAEQATWSTWIRSTTWSIWPLSGLYGVWKALSEREYLLAKR